MQKAPRLLRPAPPFLSVQLLSFRNRTEVSRSIPAHLLETPSSWDLGPPILPDNPAFLRGKSRKRLFENILSTFRNTWNVEVVGTTQKSGAPCDLRRPYGGLARSTWPPTCVQKKRLDLTPRCTKATLGTYTGCALLQSSESTIANW